MASKYLMSEVRICFILCATCLQVFIVYMYIIFSQTVVFSGSFYGIQKKHIYSQHIFWY